MRDLFIVLNCTALMALLLLVLIPSAMQNAPKNSPAAVLFASSHVVHVSFWDSRDSALNRNIIR